MEDPLAVLAPGILCLILRIKSSQEIDSSTDRTIPEVEEIRFGVFLVAKNKKWKYFGTIAGKIRFLVNIYQLFRGWA